MSIRGRFPVAPFCSPDARHATMVRERRCWSCGVGRNGEAYRDYWMRLVDRTGVLAIAIEFPETSFPDYLRYHFGNLHNEDGTTNPREKWTYGIIPRLFDALREAGVTSRGNTGCSVTPPADSLSTACCHSVSETVSPSL